MRYQIASFVLDVELARILENGEPLSLSTHAMRFVTHLVEHRERVCTRAELMKHVWNGTKVASTSLDRCASDVRSVLRDTQRPYQLVATSYGRGYRWIAPCSPCNPAPTLPAIATRLRTPAVACLPLECRDEFSGDPHIGEGLSHELVTRLTRSRTLPVIARQSSFSYAPSADPRRVGHELGAQYVVHGTLSGSRAHARVVLVLVDAVDGRELWAENFDGTLDDAFAWKDSISARIASEICPELVRAASERAYVTHRDPSALEWALRALRSLRLGGRASVERARAEALRALEIDDGLTLALQALGQSHYEALLHHWSDPHGALEQIEKASQHCLLLDPGYPPAHLLRGLAYMLRGQRKCAIEHVRLALELDPIFVRAHSVLGQLLAMDLELDAARKHVETAIELSRRDPARYRFYASMATIAFAAERFAEAIDWSDRSIDLEPGFVFNYLCKAASHGLMGERRAACDAARRLRELRPDFRELVRSTLFASLNEVTRERFLSGLACAGIGPE